MNKYPAISIIGHYLSGKSTAARILTQTNKFFPISLDVLFDGLRTKKNFDSDVEIEIKKTLDENKSVEDNLAIKYVAEKISFLEDKKIYEPENQLLMFKGMPNNLVQAKLMEEKYDFVNVINVTTYKDSSKKLTMGMRRAKRKFFSEETNITRSEIQHKMNEFVYAESCEVLQYFEGNDKLILANNTKTTGAFEMQVERIAIDILKNAHNIFK